MSEETEESPQTPGEPEPTQGAEPNQIVFGPNATPCCSLSVFATDLGPDDAVVVTRWTTTRTCGRGSRRAEPAPPSGGSTSARRRHPRPRVVRSRPRRAAPAGRLHARLQRVGTSPPPPIGGACEARRRPRGGATASTSPSTARLRDSAPTRRRLPYKVFGPHLGMWRAGGTRSSSVGALQASPAAHSPHPSVGDRHPEPRRVGRVRRGRRVPGGARSDPAAPAGRSARRSRRSRARADAGQPVPRRARRHLPGVRLWGIAGSSCWTSERPRSRYVWAISTPPTSKGLAESGIFAWDGDYYAMEIFDRLGSSETGGAVRIGFCHYHTLHEVDRVLDALSPWQWDGGKAR